MNWTEKIAPNIINYSIWVVVTVALWFTLPETIALTSEYETVGAVFHQLLSRIELEEDFSDIANLLGAFLISYLIFFINEKFSLIKMRTLLPTITASFFLTLFTTHDMHSVGGIQALLVLAIVILALTYANNRTELHTFNIGAIVAIGSINYPLFFLYIIPIISFFRFCNVFTLRTFLSLLIGFVITLLYLLPILYFVVEINFEIFPVPRISLINLNDYSDLHLMEKIFSAVVLILSVFSLFRLSIFFTHESVRQRGMFTLLFAVFLISILFAIAFESGIGYALHTITAFGALFFGCVVSTLYEKDLIVKWMARVIAVLNFVFVVVQYID